MSTVVLIHGLHLQAHSWEKLVWGELDTNIWGTVPRGVEYAWRTKAEGIVWGSGASELNGKKEAQVTYELALSRIEELAALCGTDRATLRAFVESKSVIDSAAQDTAGEIKNTFTLAKERGIADVVLIPVGSQAPIASRRALLLALEEETYAQFRHHILIAPSDGRYEGTSMNDIVIIAPAHRGDRVAIQPNVYARKTLDVIQRLSKALDTEGTKKFMTEWEELINKYQ